MSQHARNFVTDSHAICGADMLGRRHHNDLLFELTDCILCKAVLDRKHVYVVLTMDEDGYSDVNYFNTIEEQVEFSEEVAENHPIVNVMYILLPDEIPLDDTDARFIRIQNDRIEAMH